MLKALVDINALGYTLEKNLKKEALWVIAEINKLENLRNDAIHSPFFAKADGSIEAWHHLGNQRAQGLKGKKVIKEFVWFYDTTIVLREYAEILTEAIRMRIPKNPLPKRPQLPNRGSSKYN
jgi:hypothetical protein